jgi:hypothetical protein
MIPPALRSSLPEFQIKSAPHSATRRVITASSISKTAGNFSGLKKNTSAAGAFSKNRQGNYARP